MLVVEEHGHVGRPVQCAGLVTKRVLDYIPRGKEEAIIENRLRGARIHTSGDREMSFRAVEAKAYVIDRAKLDLALARQAESAGAEIISDCRYLSGREGKAKIKVEGETREVEYHYIIGADGPNSLVAREAGMDRGGLEYLGAYQAEITGKEGESDMVDLYVGNKYAPGFFAWSIPVPRKGGMWYRVGAAQNEGEMDRSLKEKVHAIPVMKNGNIRNEVGGTIPLGLTAESVKGKRALVGDAAAQVKPTSGGGLYLGLRCADILAESTAESDIKDYHQRWTDSVGKEIKSGLRLRKAFLSLGDRDMDVIVEKLGSKDIIDTIVKEGDIDYPWKAAFSIIKRSPSLLKYMPRMIRGMFG